MEGLSKKKLQFCCQALIMFLNGATKTKNMKAFFVEKQKNDCIDLITQLEDSKVDLQGVLKALNRIIRRINEVVPQDQPMYPEMDFSFPVYEVKGTILGFEHYLIQKLDEGRLTREQQIPLWQKATTIWGKTGNGISPEEGLKEFSELIDITNLLLPQNEHYPSPT